jgi:ribulose-5-phosphate 4-epimerase/fuculose-1-phosphate aldolase
MSTTMDEAQARIDLAAAFRWAARWDMHESIANHFSLALDASGTQFLLNPAGSHRRSHPSNRHLNQHICRHIDQSKQV